MEQGDAGKVTSILVMVRWMVILNSLSTNRPHRQQAEQGVVNERGWDENEGSRLVIQDRGRGRLLLGASVLVSETPRLPTQYK